MTGKRGMEADCCAKNGRITRSNRCDGNQSGNSYEVDCASHVVGQGGEAELPADIVEPARQERALAHPLLDRTEGMLDRLPATIHHLGPGGETVRHALHRCFVLEARDAPIGVLGTSFA